jgi:hypothetical protein
MKKIEFGINYFTPDFPTKFWPNVTRYGTLAGCMVSISIDDTKFKSKMIRKVKRLLKDSYVTICEKTNVNTRYQLTFESYSPTSGTIITIEEISKKVFKIETFLNPPKEACGIKKLVVIKVNDSA